MINNGYRIVKQPHHPRAWSTGYVYEHILVMEQKLGRYLKRAEAVHHKDENRLNNSPDNLELMTHSEHAKHHSKTTKMVALTCNECGADFVRRKGQEASSKGYRRTFCSRDCYYTALSY